MRQNNWIYSRLVNTSYENCVQNQNTRHQENCDMNKITIAYEQIKETRLLALGHNTKLTWRFSRGWIQVPYKVQLLYFSKQACMIQCCITCICVLPLESKNFSVWDQWLVHDILFVVAYNFPLFPLRNWLGFTCVCCLLHHGELPSGVETGVSGGSMNRGPRAPGGPE